MIKELKDKEILMLAYGALKINENKIKGIRAVTEIIEMHLYPPIIINCEGVDINEAPLKPPMGKK